MKLSILVQLILQQSPLYLLFKAVDAGVPIDYQLLSVNRHLTIEAVIKLGASNDWDWRLLSSNPLVATFTAINRYPFIPWNWAEISAHASFQLFQENLDKRWYLTKLVLNENIPLSYLAPKYRSMMPLMFNRKDFDLDWAVQHLDKFCRMRGLHLNIDMATLEANMHLPWNWTLLSENAKITDQFIQRHAEKPWGLRIEPFLYNPFDRIDVSEWSLCRVLAEFDIHNLNWVETKWLSIKLAPILEREFAALVIQKWWLQRYYDPNHTVCKKRLLREFSVFKPSLCTESF